MEHDAEKDNYEKGYDDPYLLLAYHIVCHNPPETIRRFLTDYKFVERVIVKEAKEIDLSGPFLDCLVLGVKEDDKTQLLGILGQLGKFFYRQLSLSRMRAAIREACVRLGIDDLVERQQ